MTLPPQKTSRPGPGKTPSAQEAVLKTRFTRRAGVPVILDRISRETGLFEDAEKAWGKTFAAMIHSAAFHWASTSENALSVYGAWAQSRVLPFERPLTSEALRDFLESLGSMLEEAEAFFALRARRFDEEDLIACNGTKAFRFPSGPGIYVRPMNLTVLFGASSGRPLRFRLFPGRLAHPEAEAGLHGTDQEKILAAELDGRFFTPENLARLIDHQKCALFDAGEETDWVAEALDEVRNDLRFPGCLRRTRVQDFWGKTVVKHPAFPDGLERPVHVHLFRNEAHSALAYDAFYQGIDDFEKAWGAAEEKDRLLSSETLRFFEPAEDGTLKRNFAARDEACKNFGCFAVVSTLPCSLETAAAPLGRRPLMERCFAAGKDDALLKTFRTPSAKALRGRAIVAFVALCLIDELHRRMDEEKVRLTRRGFVREEEPLSKDYSFEGMMSVLDAVEILYGGKGFEPRFWNVTAEQKEIARRLGCEGVFENSSLPAWARSPGAF